MILITLILIMIDFLPLKPYAISRLYLATTHLLVQHLHVGVLLLGNRGRVRHAGGERLRGHHSGHCCLKGFGRNPRTDTGHLETKKRKKDESERGMNPGKAKEGVRDNRGHT